MPNKDVIDFSFVLCEPSSRTYIFVCVLLYSKRGLTRVSCPPLASISGGRLLHPQIKEAQCHGDKGGLKMYFKSSLTYIHYLL
jgi:hypothetical protein